MILMTQRDARLAELEMTQIARLHLARRVTRAREAAGLTQEELAAKARLSPSYISRIENAQIPNPKWFDLEKLASALGTTAGMLTYRDELGEEVGEERAALRRRLVEALGPGRGELIDEALAVLAEWDDEREQQLALEIVHALILNWPSTKARTRRRES
jgi:transcriptional regulator with XRE-family HTH domain